MSEPALDQACISGNLQQLKASFTKTTNPDTTVAKESRLPLLHLAAAYGHKDVAEFLLQKGASINFQDEKTSRTALHLASQNGHLAVAEFLVNKGAKMDIHCKSGNLPVHLAAFSGHKAIVEIFVNKGMHINAPTKTTSLTPLHMASKNGSKAVVEYLLSKGAEVNTKSDEGNTPLHLAATFGYPDIAEILIAKGVAIEALTADNRTALYTACLNGKANVASVLLAKGARLDVRCGDSNLTPFEIACVKNQLPVAELLLSKVNINDAHPNFTFTPLHMTALYNSVSVMKFLIAKGANLHAVTGVGNTPLHIACEKDFKDIVEVLVASKANTSLKDNKGRTPLYVACENGKIEALNALLAAGVDPKPEGYTLITVACEKGHENVISILIRHGIPINSKSSKGTTPFFTACITGQEKMLDFLLKNGASLSEVDNEKESAIHKACMAGQLGVVKILISKGIDINEHNNTKEWYPIHYAANGGRKEVVEFLISKGANINAKTKLGSTPLHIAVGAEHLPVAEVLLQHGADANAQNADSLTPVFFAMDKGKQKSIELLLSKGINVNAVNKDTKTLLHLACAKGDVGLVGLLLKNKADINAATKLPAGTTPFLLACFEGKEAVVEFLLNTIGTSLLGHKSFKETEEQGPLHIACKSGKVAVVEVLLRFGADIEQRNKLGHTPLLVAIKWNQKACVQLLLQKNAKTTFDTKSALQFAVGFDSYDVIDPLLEKDPSAIDKFVEASLPPMLNAASRGNIKMVKLLLEKGAHLETACKTGLTAFQYAINNGHMEIVRLLVANGTNTNHMTLKGSNALHISCNGGHIAAVEYCLSLGFDINAVTFEGKTPMYYAADKGHTAIVELLLSKGADPTIKSKEGKTPLMLAKEKGNTGAVSVLFKKLVDCIASGDIPAISAQLKNIDSDELNTQLEAQIGLAAQDWTQIAKVLQSPVEHGKEKEISEKLQECLKKMRQGQWLGALTLLNTPNLSNEQHMARVLSIICELKLEAVEDFKQVINELYALRGHKNWEGDHITIPLFAFTMGLLLSEDKGSEKGIVEASAHSLTFLLSPSAWKKELGGSFEDDANHIFVEGKKLLSNALIQKQEDGPASNVANEWESRKRERNMTNQAMDSVMAMAGMESIKEHFLSIFDMINLDKERKLDFTKKRYNARLEGNPGTGKTTVARLYANLLKELGVLKAAATKETTGASLVEGGVAELKKDIDELKKAGGGLLFIDEAYTLNPSKFPAGKKVLDYLLPEMENLVGTLVVAVAGYKTELVELFEYNEGLPSRFPIILSFKDFSDQQLLDVFTSLAKKSNFTFKNNDVKYARIATRDLGRLRGTKGFGNARSVHNLFEQVQARQAQRIIKQKNQGVVFTNANLFTLERDDIMSPSILDSFETSCTAYKELQSMTELTKVKESVNSLINLCRTNEKLKEEEKPLYRVCLNRLFLGNPGTGKTTVAKLYARILKDLGLLSKGEVLIHTASEFVGAYLGHSEERTNKILKSAEGCVLVIDEAYGLFPGGPPKTHHVDTFRAGVINTIVERVQNVPGEDRCVIMLGYADQMAEMLQYSNPGLSRRFPMEEAFIFEDYTDEALLKILSSKLKEQGVAADLTTKMAALRILEQQRAKPNFGNAGAVANLVSGAIMRMQKRNGTGKLVESDLGVMGEGEKKVKEAEIFEGLVGCEKIVDLMHEYKSTYLLSKEKGLDPFAEGHLELNFRFVGPPGTGKTTVAQRMGLMFKNLGILQDDKVVCKTVSDFAAGNSPGQKMREVLTEGLGKVLLLDEAYRLADWNMGDAVNELVQALTEPKFQGKMVVILAGYDADIDKLMSVNQGLRSRFSQKIAFENFSSEHCIQILRGLLHRDNLQMDANAERELPDLMKRLVSSDNFSNGRDIATWEKRIFRQVAKRFASAQNQEKANLSITAEDLLLSLNSMLN